MRMKHRILAVLTAGTLCAAGMPILAETFPEPETTVWAETYSYGNLSYAFMDDGTIRITDCEETATEVEIPAKIDGTAVTRLGDEAFANCRNLTSVTIPDSVTETGGRLFENCTSLTTVTLPDSLTTISYDMFRGCSSLTRMVLPESVTEIQNSVFSDCTALKEVVIGKNIELVGDVTSTFNNCTALESITVSAGNPHFFSYDGVLYEYPKDYSGETDTVYCTDICNLLKCPQGKSTIRFPENPPLQTISAYAFQDCTLLKTIELPSVKSINGSAFQGCTALTTFRVPEGADCKYEVFYGCTSLKTLYLPNVVSFWNECTSYCPQLSDIFYDGTETEWDALDGISYCDSFRFATIHFSDGTTRQPEDFIQYEENEDGTLTAYAANKSILGSVTIPSAVNGKTVSAVGSFSGCIYLEEISLPDTIQKLGEGVFSSCSSLQQITIPDGVTRLEENAFNCCTALQQISLPEGLLYIGDMAFVCCTSLKTISLPDSLESFGGGVFNSSGLQEIVIPDQVTSLPGYPTNPDVWIGFLSFCRDLERVTLPANLKTLDEAAFCNCTALQEIVIPEGTETIGYSFADCTALTDITIPESVTAINHYAFSNTPWLEQKQAENPMVIVNDILFDGSACTGDVIVPSTVKVISNNAFEETYGLDEAFYKASPITSVVISEGVEKIGGAAFAHCNHLESVVIPSTIHELQIAYHQYDKVGMFFSYGFLAADRTVPVITILDPECSLYDDACLLSTGYDYETETYQTDTIIRGYANSTAQAYAEKYGYPFEVIQETVTETAPAETTALPAISTSAEPPAESSSASASSAAHICGDTNLDGRVDITDAVLLNKAASGTVKLNEQALVNADCNSDGSADSKDAVILLKFLVRVIDTIPVIS